MAKTNLVAGAEKKVVCIGGGHGLGNLLSSLAGLSNIELTGIVATTDNGGSTGRLKQEADTIAWGDLRNCLNQLCRSPGINQLLFEYRFQTSGDLNGHNLGNLMLYALDQMSVRPTDAIAVMRDLLRIDTFLFPMSDTPAELLGYDDCGQTIIGELAIDECDQPIVSLALNKEVSAPAEVLEKIADSDFIVLSPGSFMTSVMPSLLVADLAAAINQSQACLLLMANLQPEVLGSSQQRCLLLQQQLELLAQADIRTVDCIAWPEARATETLHDTNARLIRWDFSSALSALHDPEKTAHFMNALLSGGFE